MLKNHLSFILFFAFSLVVQAQSYTSRLKDKETKKPIPFATIQFSEHDGVLSNEEGDFDFTLSNTTISDNDSLIISCMGYQTQKIALKDSLAAVIYLKPKIYEIAPVVLIDNNMTAKDIIAKVKENLVNNYNKGYAKTELFIRSTHRQQFKKMNFDIKKSTINNLNQRLFDSILNTLPKKYTSHIESYGDSYLKGSSEGKIQLQKAMTIQNKHEITSVESAQKEFFRILQENTKPNSYLVIKTGIIRLDKTESINSIIKKQEQREKKRKKREYRKKKFQNRRTSVLNKSLSKLFIHQNKDTKVNILFKSNRYNFTKTGYVELGENLAYIVEFAPKGRAKYKGKLYINTEDYAVLRADIKGAKKIFDKHFNMLGVNVNTLTFKSTIIFSKGKNGKYLPKYIKEVETEEVKINRPIKIIEKNKYQKGRKRQNIISFRMTMLLHEYSKKEFVLNQPEVFTQASYKALKINRKYELKEFNSYNKQFWNGYNILTPEKAIQKIKIEDSE